MLNNIKEGWKPFLFEEEEKSYFQYILRYLEEEKKRYIVAPKVDEIFLPFKTLAPENIKVVIMDTSPYHQILAADGFAFSSKTGVQFKLEGLYQKIEQDLEIVCDRNPDLSRWAEQGVFLLNTFLTTRQGRKDSHENLPWWNLTLGAINYLYQQETPRVFLLFNDLGRRKELLQPIIQTKKSHLMIVAPNASRRTFSLKGDYFNKTNEFLKKHYGKEIIWQ